MGRARAGVGRLDAAEEVVPAERRGVAVARPTPGPGPGDAPRSYLILPATSVAIAGSDVSIVIT